MTAGMKLGQYPAADQPKILGRAWRAIGIKPDTVTDDFLAEWLEQLADLTLEQIKTGIDKCKALARTAPVDEFARLCKEQPEHTAPKAARVQPKLPDGHEETREESYNRLGLSARWGPLPKASE